MKNNLIIIKFGGSVITDKNKSKPTLRTSVIKELSKQIQYLYQSKKYQIILVHGAGSFGHPLAKKYGLHLGMETEEQKYGFCLTDQKMIELNSSIMDYLLQSHIPAVSLSPRSFIKQSSGKFKNFNYQLIQGYLKQNQIPVLFGDVVLDNEWGCSIISGDTIIPYLARKLKANQVIFLSDVDGIYNCDPKQNPNAKLITEVNNKNFQQVLNGLSSSGRDDVTGEMQGKILNIKEMLSGIDVFIINGLKKDRLLKVLREKKIGTRLRLG